MMGRTRTVGQRLGRTGLGKSLQHPTNLQMHLNLRTGIPEGGIELVDPAAFRV